MSGRIASTFARLARERRTALIPYVTGGDPDLDATAHVLDALVEAGADIVELGVPFSDPMADGPVIQAAMNRALAHGVRLADLLEVARAFRERHPDVPLILFGYMNPLHRYGLERAVRDMAAAGVDGLLVVDLPPEEAEELTRHTRPAGLDFIALYTPTSDDDRVRTIAAQGSGFAYCVSMTGVTGGRVSEHDALAARVQAVRRLSGVPAAVGFGVRTPEDAVRVAAIADGVVVGSALVQAMAGRAPVEAPAVAGEFIAAMRQAMDAATR
ncbi:MAG: tryptophan synthase subunit alpha [Deltaproteobacteria bacterium]|nr:tryptophan synthase subunit alpha [Deltaproteobacteria bacterium]MCB9785961.1 tryptophan synthase subunit alpha [Deltaproteobacteria bacterium]